MKENGVYVTIFQFQDAYLPLRLLEVLGCVDKYTRRSQEKGIQFNSILPDYEDAQTDSFQIADSQAPIHTQIHESQMSS
jgi:hypothetical protein